MGNIYEIPTRAARGLTKRHPRASMAGMDSDDIAPPPRASDPVALLARQDLDPLSIAELDARIVALETEIARTKMQMSRAVNHRASADQLFKR